MNAAEFEVRLYRYLRSIRRNLEQLQQAPRDVARGFMGELTPAQLQLLFTICQHDMPKISDLSKYLEIPDSHVSSMCRKLEARGYIERIRDEGDHRVVRIRATEKITKMIEEKHEGYIRKLAEVQQMASGEDLAIIISGLEKLSELLENAAKGKEQ